MVVVVVVLYSVGLGWWLYWWRADLGLDLDLDRCADLGLGLDLDRCADLGLDLGLGLGLDLGLDLGLGLGRRADLPPMLM